MTLSPKESGKLIANLAKHVKINDAAVKQLAIQLAAERRSGNLALNNFSQAAVHPSADNPLATDWIFVVDTLNFCFWKPENHTGWQVEGYTGYFALCAAINRAIKEGVDILNPKFYATITEEQLKRILRSDTSIEVPLLSHRVKCLHEVGQALIENFECSFQNCVRKANNKALNLLTIIIDNFSCFRDAAEYKGHRVSFYKRAQILIGDIWACFKGEGLGFFEDINEIAMFADYRIPQSLLYFGIFEYSDELMDKLKNNVVLNYGDEAEIEIRGCSIHAVELIQEHAQVLLGNSEQINSVLIDHYLWDFRRKHANEILNRGLPFHKTFSIYY